MSTPNANFSSDFAVEEVLPPSRAARRAQQVLVGGAVTLAVLVVGLLVARVSTGEQHTVPASASGGVSGGLAAHPPQIAVHRPAPFPRMHAAPACPLADDGQRACTTVRSVPPRFVWALQWLLPSVVTETAVTHPLRATGPEPIGGLWSRSYAGHANQIHIDVVVTRDREAPGLVVQSIGGPQTVIYVRLIQRPYTVQIEVTAPALAAPETWKVVELATDHWLVART